MEVGQSQDILKVLKAYPSKKIIGSIICMHMPVILLRCCMG